MSTAPPPARQHTHPGTRRFTLVATLTGLVLLAAATATPWTWTAPGWLDTTPTPAPPEPVITPTPTPTTPEPEPIPVDTGGLSFGDYLLVLAGLAALVALLLVLRALLARARDRPAPRQPVTATPGDTLLATDDVLPHLRDAVTTAHQDLQHAALPPRDAIVAAWIRLEKAAALAGARRDPAQTPTEFVVVVLDRTPADPQAVTTLRDLYHRARFREGDVDARDVQAARDALARLATDLAPDAGEPG